MKWNKLINQLPPPSKNLQPKISVWPTTWNFTKTELFHKEALLETLLKDSFFSIFVAVSQYWKTDLGWTNLQNQKVSKFIYRSSLILHLTFICLFWKCQLKMSKCSKCPSDIVSKVLSKYLEIMVHREAATKGVLWKRYS